MKFKNKKSVCSILFVIILLIPFIFSISTIKYSYEVNRIKTNQKVVMLTFDDDPIVNDNDIMDILDKYNIKAAFFMTGRNLEKYNNDDKVKQTVDRMVQDGHTLANHSYYHEEYLNNHNQLVKEIIDVNNMILDIYKANGITNIEFNDIPVRLPYLQYFKGLGYVQEKTGYDYFIRGYLGCDHDEAACGKDNIIKQYLKNLSPGKIFFSHSRAYAVEWLPEFIETLIEMDYQFANFSKTKQDSHSYLNYGRKLIF